MIKINSIILLITILFIVNLHAMTQVAQVARKSPALTRSAVTAARTGITRSGYIAENAGLARARSTLSMPKNQIPGQAYNRTFKQEQTKRFVQNPKVIAAAVGSTAVGLAVIAEAAGIADKVQGLYNMAMFDEDLISDEFSNAIVRIYKRRQRLRGVFEEEQGSAFIVHSDQDPDLYFVVTAAHCVSNVDIKPGEGEYGEEYRFYKQYIEINCPHKCQRLDIEPIIVDKYNDVAIFLISPREIKASHGKLFGFEVPSIPIKKLSNVRPHKKEAVVMQGYPGFLSDRESGFYRKKFVSVGPATWSPFEGQNVPGEEFTSWRQPDLSGISGGPAIAIRDKQPQILGLAALQGTVGGKLKLLATGAGELPEYIKQAEKIIQEKRIEDEKMIEKYLENQRIQQENEKMKNESWSDYFKRKIYWDK